MRRFLFRSCTPVLPRACESCHHARWCRHLPNRMVVRVRHVEIASTVHCDSGEMIKTAQRY